LLTLARDLGRFPSEIVGIGSGGYRIEVRASGWLGRWLRFVGTAREARAQVSAEEYQELLALYQLEREEQESKDRESEAMARAGRML